MAASLTIEEESGVCSGLLHPHSGRPAQRAVAEVRSLSPWGHESCVSERQD